MVEQPSIDFVHKGNRETEIFNHIYRRSTRVLAKPQPRLNHRAAPPSFTHAAITAPISASKSPPKKKEFKKQRHDKNSV